MKIKPIAIHAVINVFAPAVIFFLLFPSAVWKDPEALWIIPLIFFVLTGLALIICRLLTVIINKEKWDRTFYTAGQTIVSVLIVLATIYMVINNRPKKFSYADRMYFSGSGIPGEKMKASLGQLESRYEDSVAFHLKSIYTKVIDTTIDHQQDSVADIIFVYALGWQNDDFLSARYLLGNRVEQRVYIDHPVSVDTLQYTFFIDMENLDVK